MATSLNLNYEAASAQAERVLADVEEIDTILKNLVADVDQNIGSSDVWSGDAAKRFKEVWNNCADNFQSFVDHVRTIQQKIDYTASEARTFDTN